MEKGHGTKHLGGEAVPLSVRWEGAGAGACGWVGGSWCDGFGGWEFSFGHLLLMILQDTEMYRSNCSCLPGA